MRSSFLSISLLPLSSLPEHGFSLNDPSLSSPVLSSNIFPLHLSDHDPVVGDLQVHPSKGTVAFGSGLQGWTFTLNQFADRYAKKFGVKRETLMEKFWGENCFNPKTKKWTKKGITEDGTRFERGFNLFWCVGWVPFSRYFAQSLTILLSTPSILQSGSHLPNLRSLHG